MCARVGGKVDFFLKASIEFPLSKDETTVDNSRCVLMSADIIGVGGEETSLPEKLLTIKYTKKLNEQQEHGKIINNFKIFNNNFCHSNVSVPPRVLPTRFHLLRQRKNEGLKKRNDDEKT